MYTLSANAGALCFSAASCVPSFRCVVERVNVVECSLDSERMQARRFDLRLGEERRPNGNGQCPRQMQGGLRVFAVSNPITRQGTPLPPKRSVRVLLTMRVHFGKLVLYPERRPVSCGNELIRNNAEFSRKVMCLHGRRSCLRNDALADAIPIGVSNGFACIRRCVWAQPQPQRRSKLGERPEACVGQEPATGRGFSHPSTPEHLLSSK